MKHLIQAAAILFAGVLSACGGGGGSSGSGTAPVGQPPPPPAPANVLFAREASTEAVFAFTALSAPGGTAVAGKRLDSGERMIGSLHLDAQRNQLYVGGIGKINVYSNASSLSGTVVPSRVIVPDSQNGVVGNFFVDAANDRLYVNMFSGSIAVYENLSTLNGAVKRSRSFVAGEGYLSFDFKRNLLYTLAGHLTPSSILVFDNIDKASGSRLPVRIMETSIRSVAMALDPQRDRLYMLIRDKGFGYIEGASKAGGAFMGNAVYPPITTFAMPVPPAYTTSAMAIDAANDRLYLAQSSAFSIVNGASTLAPGAKVEFLSLSVPGGTRVEDITFP